MSIANDKPAKNYVRARMVGTTYRFHNRQNVQKNLYSSVAQWWSTRLLTDRLEVRALSGEPETNVIYFSFVFFILLLQPSGLSKVCSILPVSHSY